MNDFGGGKHFQHVCGAFCVFFFHISGALTCKYIRGNGTRCIGKLTVRKIASVLFEENETELSVWIMDITKMRTQWDSYGIPR